MINMRREEIAPGICVYDNVMPNGENLYKEIEEGMSSSQTEWRDAYVAEREQQAGVNKKTRNTLSLVVPYIGGKKELEGNDLHQLLLTSLGNLFFEHYHPIEKHYQNSFGVEFGWHEEYSVLKYGVGQFFTNHIDDHPHYPRRVSTIHYLNEDYTGGELNFPRFNLSFKPKTNQMILFPSTYTYNHSVSEVTSGTRYAIASWLR